jgi:hypothetical protein
MSYLIRIDRDSIRTNPEANAPPDFFLPGIIQDKRVVVERLGRICTIKKQTRCGDQWITEESSTHTGDGRSFPPEGITYSQERDRESVAIAYRPPAYLFDYLPLEIACENCGRKFDHSSLESDEFGDSYSNTVCPHCGTPDCADVVYERIEDALKTIK